MSNGAGTGSRVSAHRRTDTVAGDVAGLFVRVPPVPAAVWPLVDALARPYGQGQPLTWLNSVPTSEMPVLEKAPLVGTKVDLRASMGTPATIGTWTDVSSQVATSPGALTAIAGLLSAVIAADVDRAVANDLAVLGRLSSSGGNALVSLQRWPGPRLIVLSGQALGEIRDWNEYAEASSEAVIVVVDPYIGVNLVIATAGVALGVMAPASLQGDDPALFGVDVAHSVVYALEASPDAVRSWRSSGDSGGGGGGAPLPVPPTITSVVPNTGVTLGGEQVRVLGSDLSGPTEVLFGGAAAAIVFVSLGGTYIDCTTPAHAAGPVDVAVTTPDGTDTRPNAFTYIVVPPPVLTRISPTQGLPAGGEDVALTGTDLTGTSSVMFGPNPATSIVVRSATRVTCVAPAGTLGTVDVSATTLGGTGTLPAAYTYTDTPLPVPTVTAISPDNGLPAGGQAVIVTGTNLTDATEVLIGANPATAMVVNSDTEIAAVTPPGALGLADVTAVTPAGSGTLADGYTYTDAPVPPPTVTAVNPNRGLPAGGEAVVITGTSLTGASAVMFGPNPATNVVVANDTTINCNVPAGAEGAVDVSATTIEGTGTLPDGYTYATPPPTVTAVNPNSGPTAGGTPVTLTGTFFTGATEAWFGPTKATALVVVNATTITCNAPAGSAGTVDVSVITPNGSSSPNNGSFTYVAPPPPPTVTAVNPNTGLYTVTTPVTVTGTGFTGATRVEFGMNDATGLVVDSATSLRCNVPIHNAAGPCHCAVFTPNGSGRKDNAFTYIAPPPPPGVPVIQSISPNVGWTGTQARITGLWFAEPLTVEFIHSGQSYPWGVTIRDSACDPYTGAGWIDITMGDSMAGGDYDCTVTAAGGSHTYPELFYGSP